MVRRHYALLRFALMSIDLAGAVLVFIGVAILRFGAEEWRSWWSSFGADPWLFAFVFGLAWVGALYLHGLYRLRVRWSFRSEVIGIVRTAVVVAVATFVALFLLKLTDASRLFLLLLFPAQTAWTILSRTTIRSLFIAARRRKYMVRYALIVGANDGAASFADRVERHPELAMEVVGHLVSPGDSPADRAIPTRPLLGTVEQIESILHERVVDEVYVCLPLASLGLIEPVTRLCEEEGKVVRIPMAEPGLVLPGGIVEDFDGIQVLSLVYGPDRTLGLLGKRALDVAIAAVGLVVLSPVLLIVSAVMIVAEGRPVLFRQVRVGVHGRPFNIVKFRTMTRDAEARYEDVVDLSDTRGAAFKMTDDPRITRIGRVLRRTSIDEIPQLWNVLRGEMSIVGPRPAPPREVAAYDVWHRRRLSMKPGITGLWQVEARFDEEFDHRARLDLAYIDRWSIWLDIKIIARTIPAVVANPGR
jgi:exopolysaccharide biosynthesis polyprenyl glycosylphosphotransferase